jgi:transcriptional regulator
MSVPKSHRGALLQGNLELLVLKTLSWGPRHGYAIARWLEEATLDALRIEEGSLYPALYRMQERGLIAADWATSDIGKRIKVYSLTTKGRRELRSQTTEWSEFARTMARVLQLSPNE